MILPMIDTLDADDSFRNLFLPDTEAGAKIKIYPQDGKVTEFEADAVEQLDSYASNNEIMFGWKDGDYPKWNIYVTESRIIVYNPFCKGLFGKPKEKPNKATGGHVLYSAMYSEAAFISSRMGSVLLFNMQRDNGKRRTSFIIAAKEERLKEIAREVNKKVNNFIEQTGNALSRESDFYKEHTDIFNKWNSFPDDIFKDKNDEISVVVPMNSWEMAPNGRLS